LDIRSTPLRRLAALSTVASALAVAALAAAPGVTTGAPPTSCRGDACTALVTADRSPAAWRSPEVFFPRNERLYAGLTSAGIPLQLAGSHGPGRCRHRFTGGGMRVAVVACGAKTPVRVRVLRAARGSSPLRIAYAAATVLGDGPAPPPPTGPDEAPLRPITALVGR
jgi:hypothetical protein